ncbi:hypothetical protein HRbin04_00097 [archaeon HR04]|nr:hypothetical protein HRbin04_00097 [archaeon HR04]
MGEKGMGGRQDGGLGEWMDGVREEGGHLGLWVRSDAQ